MTATSTPDDLEAQASALLRSAGLRVTRQRVAVLSVLRDRPHVGADDVLLGVRASLPISTQAVYDVLHSLTDAHLLRRFQPAGSVARYEWQTGDNHHHLVCRGCGRVIDVPCAVGEAPCLELPDLPELTGPIGSTDRPAFALDQAEVTWWGTCSDCQLKTRPDAQTQPPNHSTTTLEE